MADESIESKRADINKMLEDQEKLGEINEHVMQKYSQALFKRYVFLIKAGFDEAQALELIKHRGLM